MNKGYARILVNDSQVTIRLVNDTGILAEIELEAWALIKLMREGFNALSTLGEAQQLEAFMKQDSNGT